MMKPEPRLLCLNCSRGEGALNRSRWPKGFGASGCSAVWIVEIFTTSGLSLFARATKSGRPRAVVAGLGSCAAVLHEENPPRLAFTLIPKPISKEIRLDAANPTIHGLFCLSLDSF